MVRTRVVFNLVLNEVKSREAHRIERQMVCATSVGDGKRGRAQISEGHQPLAKQWPHCFVVLQIDAANLSGSVIEIKIRTKIVVFGQRCQLRSSRCCATKRRWWRFKLSEVLRDVCL